MKNKLIIKTTAIILLTIGMIASGGSFDLGGVISPGTGYESYAAGEYDDSVIIKDNKLRIILRTLMNYSYQNSGASLYDDMSGDPNVIDITDNNFTVGNMTPEVFRENYRKPLTQDVVNEYSNKIILTPYSNISTLEGISTAKNAKSVTLPAKMGPSPNTNSLYTNVLIEASTFSGMSGLEEVIMPDTITTIGTDAFKNCGKLGTVRTYDASHTVSGNENAANLVTVTSIGANAFSGCIKLKAVTFGSGLESIGTNAFYNDTALETLTDFDKTKLTKVDEQVFYKCSSLTSVVCPATITSIDDYAFASCTGLQSLTFPVYASLSESMLDQDRQNNLVLTPVLGKYKDAFRTPMGLSVNLPAEAFTRGQNISTQIIDGHFTADYNQKETAFTVTGGSCEETGGKFRATGTLKFSNAKTDGYALTIDYPVDVVKVHIDPTTLRFDNDKFVLDGGSAGKIVKKEGELPTLYVDKNKTGKNLTLAAVAASLDAEFPGMITDAVTWTVNGDALSKTAERTTPGTDDTSVFSAYADFTVAGEGTADVTVTFNDESAKPPAITLKVAVIEGIDDLHIFLDSIGKSYRDPGAVTMPVGQTDTISASADYDAINFVSDDDSVVSVSDIGELTAKKTGQAIITVSANTGSVNKTITVNVVNAGDVVPPVHLQIKELDDSAESGTAYIGEPVVYEAKVLPTYATKGVNWTIDDSHNATLEVLSNGNARLTATGMPESKRLKLTAESTAAGSDAKNSLNINVKNRTKELAFTDESLVIRTLDASPKSISLTDDQNRESALVRKPVGSVGAVKFTSNDPSVLAIGDNPGEYSPSGVVSLSGNGLLYYKGLKAGVSKLTAETDNGVKAEINVFVTANPIVEIEYYLDSMSKNHPNTMDLTMPAGQTDKINPLTSYKDGNAEKTDYVKYRSDDNSVATVDKNGNIKAVSDGTANIKIFSASGSYERTMTVTVVTDASGVDPLEVDVTPASGKVIPLNSGESKELTAICRPTYLQKNVTWSIDNTNVATLSSTTGRSVTITGGANADKTANLTVSCGSASGVYSVQTVIKATSLEFRESAPKIKTGDSGSFILTNNKNTKSGLLRSPLTSFEEVTFTTSDDSVLKIGASDDDLSGEPVVLYANGSKLYYRGLKDGRATITARTDGGVSATFDVTVVEPATQLTCTNPVITLKRQSGTNMQIVKTPAQSSDSIIFASSNNGIATVDASGNIYAVAVGTTTIKAVSEIGGASATCSVTVIPSDADEAEAAARAAEAAIQGVYSSSLPKVSIKKPAKGKGSLTAKWKKLDKKKKKNCQGIEIWVAPNQEFKDGRIIHTAGKSKSSKKISKLGKKCTYYVKVRSYKEVNGIKYVGKWSKTKKVKTK